MGTSISAAGTGTPVRWDANGTITALPLLPGSSGGNAAGINDAGVIVGDANVNGVLHAVRWNLDGTVEDLGGLPPRAATRSSSRADPCVTGTHRHSPATCAKHAFLP